MKHLAKRTLSLLLAALMVLSLIPASNHVHAAEITTAYYGTDNTKDENLQMNGSYGTVSASNLATHAAWAIKNGGAAFVLSTDFLSDFDGAATVEIEYLDSFGANYTLHYLANDGTPKEVTSPTTTKTGSTGGTKNQTATIAVYELTDMANVTGSINESLSGSIAVINTSTSSYVGIRSIRVTKASAEPALEPEFNDADFGGYVLDQLASPALTVKNPDEAVAMTARIYVTLKKDGVADTTLNQFRLLNGETVPTAEALELVSSETMTSYTKAEGKYDLVVTSFVSVDGGDEYSVEHTVSFTRRNTLTQRLFEQDGDLYYGVQMVSGAENVAPNNFRITITGENLAEPKVAEERDFVYDTAAETTINVTKDVMSDLAYGTYTVKVEAYKGDVLRATISCEYTIEEPPAVVPEFGFISTVLDKAALPDLTITNTHETLDMTTSIKATLKLNGELHPNVQNVSVGSADPIAAGASATLISSDLLTKYATAMGDWEIVLTGTVTVDNVEYTVDKTISFTRRATFTHELVESDGNLYYNAKAVSEEATAYAPNGVKVYIENAANETVVGPVNQGVTLTTEDAPVNLKDLIKDLEPGTYTIKVEAYRNSELRGTTTCEYTVAAACEHPNAADDGDCTTAVICPDCTVEVTPAKEAHTYDNEDKDPDCNVCGFVRNIHYGTNANLGNSINLNVHVTLDAEKIENYTAKITVNGQTQDAELTANGEGTNVYFVTLPGVAAKELCDEMTVYIYEGEEVILEATDSFAAYAARMLTSDQFNDNDKKMIADMVAYAAAAQDYFGYKNGEKSVIDQLTALGVDYTDYTDDQTPACENNREVTDTEGLYMGSNFDLEENITMNMYVRGVEGGYAEISYVDYLGETKELTIQANDCATSGSYRVFKISSFVTADGHSAEVTAKFYNAEGELVVTVTDSMASYVARMGASYPWLNTMLKYASSAYAALTD